MFFCFVLFLSRSKTNFKTEVVPEHTSSTKEPFRIEATPNVFPSGRNFFFIFWNICGKLQNALAPKTTSKISPTLVEITDRQRSSSPKGITPVFKHNTHSSLKRFRVSFCSQFKEIKRVCRVQPLLKGEPVSYERIIRKGWLNMQTWPKYIYILVLLDIDSKISLQRLILSFSLPWFWRHFSNKGFY